MEDKTIVSISYSNAVVPSFDSRGKPDLLAWDEAMDEHEDSEDTLAIFYDPDVLEACKPIIEEMYADEEKLMEQYESDYVYLNFHKPPPVREEDKPTLKWFWNDVVGDFFDCEKWRDEDGNILDDAGKPFDWNSDGLYNQKPSLENYKIACMDYLIGDLGGAIHPEDAPASVWESEFQEAAKKMIELGRKLYNPDYDLEEGDE